MFRPLIFHLIFFVRVKLNWFLAAAKGMYYILCRRAGDCWYSKTEMAAIRRKSKIDVFQCAVLLAGLVRKRILSSVRAW